MMSVKSGHLLLLFYKISILIYAFLPALQNLKDASAVEVCSSPLQPASHSFLDCLVSLIEVTSQVIFQGPEQVVVREGQIQTVEWMGEQFPAILLNCLQGQTCSVRPHLVMLKDDSFLHQMFFMKCTAKFFEHLNVVSCIDNFPFFQKVNQNASLAGHGYCFHLLYG